MKVFEFEVEFIEHELLDALCIYFIEFGDEAGGDESVFESESDFLAVGEDELIEVVEYEFE